MQMTESRIQMTENIKYKYKIFKFKEKDNTMEKKWQKI